MAFIDSEIFHNGTEITNHVIEYNRTISICSGIGRLDITIEWHTGTFVDILDELILYEGGTKKGTFLVVDNQKNHDGNLVITCQDNSRKLSDYFIYENNIVPDYSYAKTWIVKFLIEAGVSYSFTVGGNGSILNNNTTFTHSTAYDVIMTLLQMSGWYMYFDPDGKCIIGELVKDISNPDFIFDDTDIQKLIITDDDKMLRNRAVVWGIASPEEKLWVYTDQRRPTPYDTSPKDLRAIVYANNYIRNTSAAKTIAHKLLDEFANKTTTKYIELVREENVRIGDIVESISNYWAGMGLVTTTGSKVSATEGQVTFIYLDERCPRLFGYFGGIVPVYIGTDGSGVWKKPLDSGLWYDFSTGLIPTIPDITNPNPMYVPDLIIKNGIFACVNGTRAYRNLGHSVANWKLLEQGFLYDLDGTGYAQAAVKAIAVDIDTKSNNIFVGYRLRDIFIEALKYNRSWICEFSPNGKLLSTVQVQFNDDKKFQDFKLIDIDKYGPSKIVSCEAPATYSPDIWNNRSVLDDHDPDGGHCFGIVPREDEYTDGFITGPYAYGGYGNHVHYTIEGNTTMVFLTDSFLFCTWSGDTAYSIHEANVYDTGPYTNLEDVVVYRDNVIDVDWQVAHIYNDADLKKLNHYSYVPLLEDVYPKDKGDVAVYADSPVSLAGWHTIDGVALNRFQKVLVANQSDSRDNGIYVVSKEFEPWIRTSDTLDRGAFVRIYMGDTYKNTMWQVDTATLENRIGIDPILFTEVMKQTAENTVTLYNDAEYSSYSNVEILDVKSIKGTVYVFITANRADYKVFITVMYSLMEKTVKTSKTEIALEKIDGNLYETMLSSKIIVVPSGKGYCYVMLKKKEIKYDMRISYDESGIAAQIIYVDTERTEIVDSDIMIYGIKNAEMFYSYKQSNESPIKTVGPREIIDIKEINFYTFSHNINGESIETAIKVFLHLKWSDNWQCKGRIDGEYLEFIGTCGLKISGASGEFVGINVLDNPKRYNLITGQCKCGGFGCDPSTCDECSRSLYDDWPDFTEISIMKSTPIPLTSHNGQVLAIYKDIVSGVSVFDVIAEITGPIAYITRTSKYSPILDEFDGCIYAWDDEYFIKMDLGGSILAKIPLPKRSLTPFFSSIIFTNGLLIGASGGRSDCSGIKIHKVADAIVFPEMYLCFLLKQDIKSRIRGKTFNVIDTDFYSLKIEGSKDYPLLGWSTLSGLISYQWAKIVNGDIINTTYSGPGQHLKLYNESLIPSIIYCSGISDSRSVDLSGSFYLVSGMSESLDYGQYAVTAGVDDILRIINHDSLDASAFKDVYATCSGIYGSGLAYCCETSNRYVNPYLFVSTSGSIADNVQSMFFQRNPYSASFIDYSALLPSGGILTIRLDDMI